MPANLVILNGYLKLINLLSDDNKMELITRIIASIKSDKRRKSDYEEIKNLFGSLEGDGESAEQMIERIRTARVSTRQIEQL